MFGSRVARVFQVGESNGTTAVRTKSNMAAGPILDNFERPYLCNGSSDPLHVWFYGRVFEIGGSIEWPYIRLDQIQDPGRQPSCITLNGHISLKRFIGSISYLVLG